VQQAIQRVVNQGATGWSCWDLGAHFGLYSVALARIVGPTGQVAAFEPNPLSYGRLELHKRMNRLPWLRLYPAAVSNFTGTAELLTYGNLDSTSTHLKYADETLGESAKPLGIRTVRLDDLVESGELRAPNFVKIDVEGHAQQALAGMAKTLSVSRPTFIIGLHSQDEVDGVLEALVPLGYGWSAVVPSPIPDSMVGGDYLFTAAPR
jgi:FkbM family methyltransferase